MTLFVIMRVRYRRQYRNYKLYIFTAIIMLLLLWVSGALINISPILTSPIKYSLDGPNWYISDGNKFKDIQTSVPNDIYSSLYSSSKIADPYLNSNDVELRSIGERDYNFSRKLTLPMSMLHESKAVYLIAHGIDTIASVYVNDKLVGNTDNMFREYHWDITSHLVKSPHNMLVVAFTSPVKYSVNRTDLAKDDIVYNLCQPGLVNGICQINYIRKMQSSFGWDWGPAFPTQGIWRPIYLKSTHSCIINQLSAAPIKNSTQWMVLVTLKLLCAEQTTATLVVSIPDLGFEDRWNIEKTKMGENTIERIVVIPSSKRIRLWYPIGYGNQVLYTILSKFIPSGSNMVPEYSRRVKLGFRTVELIQEPIQPGNGLSFYIRINGIDVFLKGTNWIPDDSFLSRVSHSRLEYLFESMVEANMNSLRVWGGGVYESDYFYELADRHGLLIWHDMMFACSAYPASHEFLESVRKETVDQVLRLRHHPSIIVWGGNNENELGLVGYWFHWSGPNASMQRAKVDYLKLYNSTIWGAVNNTDPTRPYVMSSPSNGLDTLRQGGIARSPGASRWGDMHVYEYSRDGWLSSTYPKARCVTEYGFQSLPSMSTLKTAISDEKQLGYFSKQMLHRQHHTGGTAQLLQEVLLHFNLPQCNNDLNSTRPSGKSFNQLCKDPIHKEWNEQKQEYEFLKGMIYLSQIHQAIAYQTETENYRRWRNRTENGEGECMCAMYWQLNDIWQAPSWSTIDYKGRWKAAHYYANKFFAQTMVSPYWTANQNEYKIGVLTDNLSPIENSLLIVEEIDWAQPGNISHSQVPLGRLAPLTGHIVHTASLTTSNTILRINLLDSKTKTPLAPESILHPRKLFLINSALFGTVKIEDISLISPAQFGIKLSCDKICPFVWLEQGMDIHGYFSDNAFTMTRNECVVRFKAWDRGLSLGRFKQNIEVWSLGDLYR